jgi:hypothetical protein
MQGERFRLMAETEIQWVLEESGLGEPMLTAGCLPVVREPDGSVWVINSWDDGIYLLDAGARAEALEGLLESQADWAPTLASDQLRDVSSLLAMLSGRPAAHPAGERQPMVDLESPPSIEELLDPTEETAERIVRLASEREHELVAALSDRRYLRPYSQWDGGLFMNTEVFRSKGSPASRPLDVVLRELLRRSPKEAVLPVAALLNIANDDVRQEAAFYLGMCGQADAMPGLRVALGDDHHGVHTMAFIGIHQAVKAERLTPDLRTELLSLIEEFIKECDYVEWDFVADCVLSVDAEAVAPLLMTGRLLSIENEGLHYILQALREHEVAVDPAKLREFFEAAWPDRTDYPGQYVVQEVLEAVGAQREVGMKDLVDRALALQAGEEEAEIREVAVRIAGALPKEGE